jgi:hypothetical protein
MEDDVIDRGMTRSMGSDYETFLRKYFRRPFAIPAYTRRLRWAETTMEGFAARPHLWRRQQPLDDAERFCGPVSIMYCGAQWSDGARLLVQPTEDVRAATLKRAAG